MLFSTKANNTITTEHEFGFFSLYDDLPDLIKVFPQNFEISTNNGRYKFNKDLIKSTIPIIKDALVTETDLKEYHFDINDEQNVMQKFEKLFKGESVEFVKSEEETIKQITSYFDRNLFPIPMYSGKKLSIYYLSVYENPEFPEKMKIQMELDFLFNRILQPFFSNSQKTYKIKTNQNEYMCDTCGISSSKKILEYIKLHPTSNEFYFDFDEQNNELAPIISFFNWDKLQVTANTMNSILDISEQLQITTLIDQVKHFIKDINESISLSIEHQHLIDPYDILFEKLFNIKELGTKKVADFIMESKWLDTKSDIREFAACLIQVSKKSLSYRSLAELVQILSSRHIDNNNLSSLVPFLVHHLFSFFIYDYHLPSEQFVNNSIGFLYQMSQFNLIPIDTIIKKILFTFTKIKQNRFHHRKYILLNLILWFLPEINDDKRFSKEIVSNLLKEASKQNKGNSLEDIPIYNRIDGLDLFSNIRLLRDGCGQKKILSQSIKNDDVDTFQLIVTSNMIDIHKKKIKLSIFEGIRGEIAFIDYSAFCGSLKCFKYLFLEKVPISSSTFNYAVQGGNTEIIHILDQNNNELKKNGSEFIKSAICYHRNDIFDWLIENSSKSFTDFNELLNIALMNGNAHVVSKVIENGMNLNCIEFHNLSKIIEYACSNGFYKILLYLSKLVSFSDFFDPKNKKYPNTPLNKITRYVGDDLNSSTIKEAVRFGNFKIFELIFNSIKERYSIEIREAIIEAAKFGNIEIVKYLIDKINYQLSNVDLVNAICYSIESGCEELIDYLFNQMKDFTLINEILIRACTVQNLTIVKRLVQMANENHISIDFTEPFINAVSPCDEEIVKYFIELKVDLNFRNIFSHLIEIANMNCRVIFLLINETKSEIKSNIIRESTKAALSENNVELLKFLMTNKYEIKDLLIIAARISNLEIIKTILEFNHSKEFINRIGKDGTALFEVIKSTGDINVRVSKDEIIKYLLEQEGIDPSISVDSISTPLVEAVKVLNVKAVELILDFYSDRIKDQGKQIYNAFNVIFQKQSNRKNNETTGFMNFMRLTNTPNGETMIFKHLLKVKQYINIDMCKDFLLYSILENDESLVKDLLNDESIDFDHRFENGDTYLHVAINQRFTPIQRLLLNHPKIDINAVNGLNQTPLVKAVECNNKELVELILNHPKFDPSRSLLEYAFFLSTKTKDILKCIIKIDSLDVNYNHIIVKDKQKDQKVLFSNHKPIEEVTTPLTEAVKIGDLEIVKSIVNHHSFDPIRSHIIACISNSIKTKNLNLFKFLVELNGGEINLKNIKNKSLLCIAASTGGNPLILKEILYNEKFDPIKSDIQKSFLKSTDAESMKILVSYDEDHKMNLLSIDKIPCEFLLRKNGLLPTLPSICINIVLKDHLLYHRTYICKTCKSRYICEICARVCHKGHEIYEAEDKKVYQYKCNCGNECKCTNIIHDELYDKFKALKEQKKESKGVPMSKYNENNFNENEDEEVVEEKFYDVDKESNECEKDIGSLKCTLDLAGFNSMSQPMYRCRKCKVDICQSCAIRCHKDHPLNFKGFKLNALCQCLEATDCCCTSRKDVVCTYAIYGVQHICQPFYNCTNCAKNNDFGCCTACTKKCHKGHNFKLRENFECFCDCGAGSLPFPCKAMAFPPFNYLSSCTNREQKYQIKMQRLYHCLTCGLTAENQGICEACAIHCHLGHKVEYIGMCEFACECITMNKCNTSRCPEISSDGMCSRAKNCKNDLLPAFVCSSCDKEGKMMICKSCALNCHKNHEVHFLKYSNFECQCNPCKCTQKMTDKNDTKFQVGSLGNSSFALGSTSKTTNGENSTLTSPFGNTAFSFGSTNTQATTTAQPNQSGNATLSLGSARTSTNSRETNKPNSFGNATFSLGNSLSTDTTSQIPSKAFSITPANTTPISLNNEEKPSQSVPQTISKEVSSLSTRLNSRSSSPRKGRRSISRGHGSQIQREITDAVNGIIGDAPPSKVRMISKSLSRMTENRVRKLENDFMDYDYDDNYVDNDGFGDQFMNDNQNQLIQEQMMEMMKSNYEMQLKYNQQMANQAKLMEMIQKMPKDSNKQKSKKKRKMDKLKS